MNISLHSSGQIHFDKFNSACAVLSIPASRFEIHYSEHNYSYTEAIGQCRQDNRRLAVASTANIVEEMKEAIG